MMKRFVASSLLTLAGLLVPAAISEKPAAAAGTPVAAVDTPVATVSLSMPDPGDGGSCGKKCWGHYVVFRGSPMLQFLKHVRHTPSLRRKFDMSNNGCSVPDWIDTHGYERIFRRACVVHDFGYRNFGPGEIHVDRAYLGRPQRRWSANTDKEYIDRRFKQLMDRICEHREDSDGWDACEFMAEAFYRAVRHGGNDAWHNG